MNEDENTKIKLFGFRINNTVVVILFFLVFPMTIGYIRPMYSFVEFFIQLIGGSLSELSSYSVLQLTITFFISLALLILYIYILVVSSKSKKFYSETEENQTRWLGFRLNSTSLITIGVLSIVNIILGVIALYSIISNFIYIYVVFSFPLPSVYTTGFILNLIESLILMVFYIYTIIVCKNTRSILDNSNPH